jgi:mediator of RNA polymerase II transcription subunit 12, fungi type
LYGVFKHKSGLQTLSTFFAAVVEERQAHSKISSSSAFKPPPRVTLTEAKRKAWLSDLANPVVPLRKLSRTIPQGIRGQTLLDQCFINGVPTGRALWFARCVGANEIRTLKRKGASATFAAGAEIKWLRDWTTNIEQFVENSIGQRDQPSWRPRLNYAFSLAVRIYSESLLDRDHYLDWIVKSTSSASLDILPVWLLMVNLHRVDLLKHRKRGRSLTESLLQQLLTVGLRGQDLLEPLARRLKQILSSVMRTNIACFVIPQSWKKYKSTVETCFDLNNGADLSILKHISHRNERLLPVSNPKSPNPLTPRQAAFRALDSASSPFNVLRIAEDCVAACDNTDLLVDIILEWCSSKFRTGKYRVYLAVRLLKIYRDEIDINSSVIKFLASQQDRTAYDSLSLCLLVSELIKSQVFLLSRYLQWLTARGGLQSNSLRKLSSASDPSTEDNQEEARFATGFGPVHVLTSVPLANTSPSVRNLRNILLSRAGFSIDEEASCIESYKGHLATKLPRIFQHEVGMISTLPGVSKLNWSARSEIALFLKQNILMRRASKAGAITKERSPVLQVSEITDPEFRFLRSVCEELGDLAILTDVIRSCLSSDDEKLLASITDTVNFHVEVFSSLGTLEELHSHLFRAYLSLRTSSDLPRLFITSLIALGSLLPSDLVSVSSLRQDLAWGDRSLAIAACSPVSDGMAETLQQAGPTFAEEFEAVLSTGNRMEEQTMTQLFNVLVGRMEKGLYQTQAENDEILCALQARLRIYRIAQFDSLITAWLRRLLTSTELRVMQLLPILITTGCISFGACIDVFLMVFEAKQSSTYNISLTHAHLASFLEIVDTAEKGLDSVSYKLKLENARHIKENPDRALEMRIRGGAWDISNRRDQWNGLLIGVVLKEQKCDKSLEAGRQETIGCVLDNMLQLQCDGSTFAFPELVKKTNDLSMPFCRYRLQLWAAVNSPSSLSEGYEAVVETLFHLAKSDDDDAWVYYATAIGPDAANQVRERAEEAFFALSIFNGPGRSLSSVLPLETCMEQARTYMRIISRTAYSIPSVGVQQIVPTLVERFAAVLRGLIAARIPAANENIKQGNHQFASTNEEPTSGNIQRLVSYLTLLLQMTSIHRTAFVPYRPELLSSPIASQKQGQQDIVKTLVLLTNIALHPSLAVHSSLVEQLFDVAATIVDDVPDEVKALCSRILKDKMRDHRTEHLFGSANTSKSRISGSEKSQIGWTTDGLQLIKDGKRVGEYKSRNWEMLEGGAEASISLSLFDTRREV